MGIKEVFKCCNENKRRVFLLGLVIGILMTSTYFFAFHGYSVMSMHNSSFSGQVEDFSAVFDNDSSTFAVVGDGAVMDFSYAFKSERIYLKLDAREGYYDVECLSNDSEYVFIERVNGSFEGELDLPLECGDLELRVSYFVYDNVSEEVAVNSSSGSSGVVVVNETVADNSSIVEGNVTSEENSSAVVESNETVAENSSTVEGNNDSGVSEDNSTVEEGINEGGEVVGENVTGEESVGENSSEETFSASVEEEIVEGEIVEEEGVVEENSEEIVEGETIITGEVIEGGYGRFYEIKVYGVEEGFEVEGFSTSFSGAGNGTDEDPFQITTCDELNETRNNLTASYILMNDINFSDCDSSYTTGSGWVPIGNSTSGYMFAGNFDGQNYTIYDLYINRPTEDYVGLFGYLVSGTIRDLILMEVNISGRDYTGAMGGYSSSNNHLVNLGVEGRINGGDNLGGLVGYFTSNILNSYVEANVTGGVDAGGLVGKGSGTIEDSYSGGSFSGYGNIGGLVGTLTGILNNSYSKMDIYCSNGIAGGLVGDFTDADISNSHFNGTINSLAGSIGGIGGFSGASGSISNSYVLSNISSSGNNIGGLVGVLSYYSSVSNSYFSGYLNSTGSRVGGLIGSLVSYSSLEKCYSVGKVESTGSQVGGTVGFYDSFSNLTGFIINIYSNVTVIGKDSTGGLVGQMNLGRVDKGYFSGSVLGTSKVGGVIGNFSGGVILSVYYDQENSTIDLAIDEDFTGAQTWANLTDYFWLMDNGWNFYEVWSSRDSYYPYLGGGNADYPLNGSGASSDPYQVDSCQELDLVRYRLSSNFILTGDINFSECDSSYTNGAGWDPIGSFDKKFSGDFDGQNYTISNLYILRPESYVGLFGYVYGGEIRNLAISEANVFGSGTTGALVGFLIGDISHINVSGIVGGGTTVGGVVGRFASGGSLSNVFSEGVVNSGGSNIVYRVGGLVGSLQSPITNSYSTANVSASNGAGVGGLFGYFGDNAALASNAYHIGEKYFGSLVNSSAFASSAFYKGYHLTIQNVTNTTGDYLDNVRIRTYDNLGVTHRTVYTNATGWTNESWSVDYKETSSGKTNLTTFVEAKLNGYKKKTLNLGHQTANNETFFSEMIVDNDTPVVNSLSPSSSYVGNINFTFFLFDDSDTNCTVYVNSQPYAIIEGDIDNSTNSQVLTFGTAGTYPWFVSCEDWNGLQTNSSVVNLVLTNPPSGESSGGWGSDSTPIELPSEDTGVEGDSGTSTSGVSTSEIISTSGGSSCVRDVSCLEWSECDAAYKIEDLVEGVETIDGEQKRLCKDANGCVNNYYEIQECSIALNIYVEEKEWCGRSYLEVYDNSTGELLTRIDDNKDEEIPSVNILFTGAAVQDICESCFDNVQNGDEEGVDCGGSCPECGDLERFSIIDFILQRMVFWG